MHQLHLPHLFHHTQENLRFNLMLPYLWSFVAALLLGGFVMDTPQNILRGLDLIIHSEASLITDYVLLAGPGAALVNASIVTAISILIMYFSQDTLNGMSPVIVGLMAGFSLFGKNFLNIWPILIGTWLYARLMKEPFGSYCNIGLMATALAPLVSYVWLDNGWGNPFWATLIGLIIGFIMPPLAAHTFQIQNGMNLYNTGFACGLLAFILVPIISSLGATPTTRFQWATEYNTVFSIFLFSLCIVLILGGFFSCKLPPWAVWAGYRRLLQMTGRSPDQSDFLRLMGPAPVLVNTGINGLIGMGFILLIGGDLNGPTVGGILTIMGFSSFGKHARNMVPIMLGVALGGFIMHWNLSDPAVQLACLFCTTLAPISGYFGWQYGILAGFLHSSVVLYTGSPVAGLNLYNNGFSGGLVSIVLYPCILTIIHHRKPELQRKEYSDTMEHDEPIIPPEPDQFLEKDFTPTSSSQFHHPYE